MIHVLISLVASWQGIDNMVEVDITMREGKKLEEEEEKIEDWEEVAFGNFWW